MPVFTILHDGAEIPPSGSPAPAPNTYEISAIPAPVPQADFPLSIQWQSEGADLGRPNVRVLNFIAALDQFLVTRGTGEQSNVITVRKLTVPPPPPPASLCSVTLADESVFVLDVGDADSYPGAGQEIFNVIPTPDDGSPQAAYDYWLGRTSSVNPTDPRFAGTAGDCSGYFWINSAGSYCLTAKQATTFLQTLHHAGSRFTIEMWMYRDVSGRPDFGTVPGFDTGCRDNGGPYLSGPGLYYTEWGSNFSSPSEHMISFARTGDGAAWPLFKVADAQVDQGRVNMLACSIDTTGAVNSFFYKNGSYDPSGGVNTWSAAAGAEPFLGGNPVNLPCIMGRADGVAATAATRFYLIRVYNRPLTKVELDTNWNALRGRWGL